MAFDPVTVAATAITNIVIKTVWDDGRGFIGRLGGGLDEARKQLIYSASQQYIKNYTERHGILKVLGMREPVALRNVYTAVRFLGREDIQLFGSIDELETTYRKGNLRRFQIEKCEKQDGLAVANKQKFLMVLGQPGAGKSTFLRRMGLEALEGRKEKYQHECIPVFIELKRFTTSNIDLKAVITEEFETCKFPSPERSADRLLEKGKLLILLDGLDEVPTDQLELAINRMQDFVDRYSQNRFIASCRTAAYRSGFRRFADVIMADFDDEQIEQFITTWFQSAQDQQGGTAQRCWNLLQQSEYSATKELAQTPLLLTLLCLVFDDSQTFPKNRSELYGEALDVLLKKWSSEKRIQRAPIYQDLSVPLEKMMLAEIASRSFRDNRLFFSKQEAVERIEQFLKSNLNAPQSLDGERVLEAIQIQQGILVERARNVLSFSHLTLQEYLTAKYIVDYDRTQTLVKKYLTDERWREVFLLVAGLLPTGADSLLQYMEQEIEILIDTEKLRALIKWTDSITTSSQGKYKPAAKRSVALFSAFYLTLYLPLYLTSDSDRPALLLFTLEIARTFKLKLDKFPKWYILVHKLDEELNQELNFAYELDATKVFSSIASATLIKQLEDIQANIPSNDALINEHPDIINRLRQIWYDAFHLINPEWLDLSKEEIRSLENYLYANELMIRCKEAAVRVSPQVWEAIESRMLTVRDN